MAKREREAGVELGGAVPLRRPPGRTGTVGRVPAPHGDRDVAAAGQLLEVVAGDVGVEREVLGDLRGGDAGRAVAAGAAHEEVDLAPGGVAERVRDGRHRGVELLGRERVDGGVDRPVDLANDRPSRGRSRGAGWRGPPVTPIFYLCT